MRARASIAAAVFVTVATVAALVGAAEAQPGAKAPRVQMLGEGMARLYLVDHGDSVWSMHAEVLGTVDLLRMWREAGGPEVIAKAPVDRPYTISVHRVKVERLIERVLDGYGYTLHYDATGRLSQVRVYSPEPTQPYKTPRLTESLAAWRDAETPAPAADDASAVAPIP